MSFYVYIIASRRNGTLYTGMTDNLVARTWQHREGIVPGFTREHGVKTLVWFEQHDTREAALLRERQIKKVESEMETGDDRKSKSYVA